MRLTLRVVFGGEEGSIEGEDAKRRARNIKDELGCLHGHLELWPQEISVGYLFHSLVY